MAGNVWEWTEDDWHTSYVGAPNDGSAWIESPRLSKRVVRGGSYGFSANFIRTSFRGDDNENNAAGRHGFRLVR